MGTWRKAVFEANRVFGPEVVYGLDAEALAERETLAGAMRLAGVADDDELLQFVDSWPPGQQMAIRGAVRAALRAEPRMCVNFAYVQSPVHELTIWETPGDGDVAGEITILIKAPPPGGGGLTAPAL